MANVFRKQGYQVFTASRSLETMSEVESLPNVKLHQLDVTKSTDIRDAVGDISKETDSKLTYFVNFAARIHFMPLLDMPLLDEDIEAGKALYDLNVWGPLPVTQVFAPLLIKSKGTVVFITSLSGYLNVPYQGLVFYYYSNAYNIISQFHYA